MSKNLRSHEHVSFDDYLKERLTDPEFAAIYEETKIGVDVGLALSWLRESRHLSQRDLAKLSQMKQPQIARIEGGQLPSIPVLQRLLAPLGARLILQPDGQIVIEPAETKGKAA